MKNFQLLAIAATLSVAGWVHAGTPTVQVESKSIASESVVAHDTSVSPYIETASFQSNASKPLAQVFNFNRVDAPFYLVSPRVSHVPEPEGWSMMLLGAGFVVYQIRRRKRARESWDLR